MKKLLIALLVWAMLCAAAAAETHPMITVQRMVGLPEGYYLLNGNTMDRVAANEERWSALKNAQGEDFARKCAEAGEDVVMSQDGSIALRVQNSGFVGGSHTRMPELVETIRKDLEAEFAENGAQLPEGDLVRQYAGRMYVGAVVQTGSGNFGRLVTIDDVGNRIDISSYVDEETTQQLMNCIAQPAGIVAEAVAQPAGIAPESVAQSREEIFNELGVFSFDGLEHVKGVEMGAAGELLVCTVHLKEGVYGGDGQGYLTDWRTGEGVMSDVHADLDGDGTDEYLILHVQEEKNEYGAAVRRLKLAVYEPANGGYVLADECSVMDHNGFGQRYVRLVSGGGKLRVAVGERWYAEGGWLRLRNNFYSYDGAQLTMDAVTSASAGGRDVSYAAEGAMDPDTMKAVREAAMNIRRKPDLAQQLGLEKNIEAFESDGAQMTALRSVAERLAAYGLNVSFEQTDASCVAAQIDGGDLLWFSEERPEEGKSRGDACVELLMRTTAQRSQPAGEVTVRALDNVKVRTAPGTHSEKITTLKKGESVPYAGMTDHDAEGRGWIAVHVDEKIGWVSAQYAAIRPMEPME